MNRSDVKALSFSFLPGGQRQGGRQGRGTGAQRGGVCAAGARGKGCGLRLAARGRSCCGSRRPLLQCDDHQTTSAAKLDTEQYSCCLSPIEQWCPPAAAAAAAACDLVAATDEAADVAGGAAGGDRCAAVRHGGRHTGHHVRQAPPHTRGVIFDIMRDVVWCDVQLRRSDRSSRRVAPTPRMRRVPTCRHAPCRVCAKSNPATCRCRAWRRTGPRCSRATRCSSGLRTAARALESGRAWCTWCSERRCGARGASAGAL